MSSLKILVFLGSIRQGRNGERVARLIMRKVKEAGHSPVLMDPKSTPEAGQVIQPLHFRRNDVPPAWMVDMNKQIIECDGIIVVTPEYNCTLPPALTAFLDNFPPSSYGHKPAGIACYSMGSFGGIRAAAAARPFLSELKMITTPSVLVIPQVSQVISEESLCDDEKINKNAEKLVEEVIWYSQALANQKKEAGKIPI